MKKLGLALGGGGLKGLAHIGILQVLEDNDIPIAMLSGTSAGSIAAALYASGISAYIMEEIVLKLNPYKYLDYNISGLTKYFLSLFIPGVSYNLDGIIKGNRVEKLIYQLTRGKRLRDSKIPLAIIACDIDSGREVVFSSKRLANKEHKMLVIEEAFMSQAVRASIAIPAAFVPAHLQGMQLVDGGVRSMVPIMIQKYMGAEYILAINLGEDIYQQKVNGIIEIADRTLNILTYETSAMDQQLYADMVIYPQVGEVKLEDWDNAADIIRVGRRVMKNRIDKLKRDLLDIVL
ncbi:MAG: patatin-like phospholipase family protein [Syntrophomonadaceae bacterium]